MSENTFWEGAKESKIEVIQASIPQEGPVKDAKKRPALEMFRKASHIYYRLYNDGDWTPAARGMFKMNKGEIMTPTQCRWGTRQSYTSWDLTRRGIGLVEEKMDAIVDAAILEDMFLAPVTGL